MKRLKKVTFEYEDGTQDQITDFEAVGLFQSRINTSGILSGMEGRFNPVVFETESKDKEAEE